jgi:hypothetical protein
MKISRDDLTRFMKNVYPFNFLDGDNFDSILDTSEVVFFPEGKMIYLEDSPAVFFYLIHTGQIEILKEKNHTLNQINVLNSQFAFGEDALSDNQKRQTSARALTDVVLVKISSENIHQIRKTNPIINKNILIMISSYTHLVRKRFPRAKDETIFYIGHPHKSILLLKTILTLITTFGIGILFIILFNSGLFSQLVLIWMGGVLSGVSVFWMGWQYLEWSNELFYFTNKRVINQQRSLFSFETKQETPVMAIESIQVRKSLFSRALGFGDLEIKTFTGSVRVPFVPELLHVEKIITYLITHSKNLVSDKEKKAFEEDIKARLSKDTSIGLINNSNDRDTKPDLLLDVDAGSVKTFSKENDIVFHTHWTILFSKIFVPIALLLAHASLYLFLTFNQFQLINSNFFNGVIITNCIFLLCCCVYRIFDWKNDVYIISKDQLIDIDRHPFGMEEKKTAPIKNIQLIRYKKNGITGLLFNYGTVFIRVGDEEFTFNNVHRPEDVQETLFIAKERYHKITKQMDDETDRRKAVEWIDSYHRVANDLRGKDKPKSKENDSNLIK